MSKEASFSQAHDVVADRLVSQERVVRWEFTEALKRDDGRLGGESAPAASPEAAVQEMWARRRFEADKPSPEHVAPTSSESPAERGGLVAEYLQSQLERARTSPESHRLTANSKSPREIRR